MFEGFALEMIELPEATLRVRHGGAGSPVLLLHGHPRTHATRHHMAEETPEALADALLRFLQSL